MNGQKRWQVGIGGEVRDKVGRAFNWGGHLHPERSVRKRGPAAEPRRTVSLGVIIGIERKADRRWGAADNCGVVRVESEPHPNVAWNLNRVRLTNGYANAVLEENLALGPVIANPAIGVIENKVVHEIEVIVQVAE